jgi:lipoprotein-releasing system permease protein
MMLVLKLALRNLGRNRRRTLITGLALALSAALSIAYYGLIDGMNEGLVHALTRFDLGHLQVHAAGYTKHRALENTLPDAAAALAEVRRDPAVRAAAARTYAAALVGAGQHSTGVELVGIDPETERHVTELDRQLVSGTFVSDAPTPWPEPRALSAEERALDTGLTEHATERAEEEIDALPSARSTGASQEQAKTSGNDTALARRLRDAIAPPPSRPPDVVLGKSLARVLGVEVGGELFLSTAAVDGTAEGVKVRVAGIFETGTASYDRGRIYLNRTDLGRMVHLRGRAHEIAAVVDSPDLAKAAAARLRGPLGHLDVRSWSELRPDIVQLLALNRAGGWLLAAIVFFVASLGVVNTMLMSVLERTRELGVQKAIGMSGAGIFSMVLCETFFLAVWGAIAGMLLGLGMDWYLVVHGFDLGFITGGVSMAGIGMAPVVKGAITTGGVLWPIAVLTVVCLVAAVYPAARAARMQPAVGMRET